MTGRQRLKFPVLQSEESFWKQLEIVVQFHWKFSAGVVTFIVTFKFTCRRWKRPFGGEWGGGEWVTFVSGEHLDEF